MLQLQSFLQGTISFVNDSLARQLFGSQVGSYCRRTGCHKNQEEGSIWVFNHILEFCEKMGLGVQGKEAEVFDFLASIEATMKKAVSRVDEEEEVAEVRERTA